MSEVILAWVALPRAIWAVECEACRLALAGQGFNVVEPALDSLISRYGSSLSSKQVRPCSGYSEIQTIVRIGLFVASLHRPLIGRRLQRYARIAVRSRTLLQEDAYARYSYLAQRFDTRTTPVGIMEAQSAGTAKQRIVSSILVSEASEWLLACPDFYSVDVAKDLPTLLHNVLCDKTDWKRTYVLDDGPRRLYAKSRSKQHEDGWATPKERTDGAGESADK